jgi:hypothetical protein
VNELQVEHAFTLEVLNDLGVSSLASSLLIMS